MAASMFPMVIDRKGISDVFCFWIGLLVIALCKSPRHGLRTRYLNMQVVLGAEYNAAADMWSFGCMAAELFLGLPLFPGACEHDLLTRIVEMFGLPPHSLLRVGKYTKKFFKEEPVNNGSGYMWVLRNKQEFEEANNISVETGNRGSVCFLKHVNAM